MRKQFAIFTALLILISNVTIHAETATDPFLSDYDHALRIIEECNPFIQMIRESNPDYDALCNECRGIVRSRCQSAEGLQNVLAELFYRLGNPGHLSILAAADYREYDRLAEQGVIGENSLGYRLIHDEKTRSVYMDMEYKEAEETDWNNRYIPYVNWDSDRGILYIRIQSFRHSLIERDRNVLADAFEAHPDAKHIVFDICGNGGGSDYYWMNLLVSPFGETVTYEKRAFFRENELTREYGYMEDAVPVSMLEEKDIPDFVRELGFTHMSSGTITIEPAEGIKTIQTGAKRWVLTDEYVYSAADGFAGFCKQAGWAILVGRRTKGDGGSMAPCLIRLPETGLLMRFTVAADANQEGKLNTFYGTNPDFPSKPFEHPYDTLLRIIDTILD